MGYRPRTWNTDETKCCLKAVEYRRDERRAQMYRGRRAVKTTSPSIPYAHPLVRMAIVPFFLDQSARLQSVGKGDQANRLVLALANSLSLGDQQSV